MMKNRFLHLETNWSFLLFSVFTLTFTAAPMACRYFQVMIFLCSDVVFFVVSMFLHSMFFFFLNHSQKLDLFWVVCVCIFLWPRCRDVQVQGLLWICGLRTFTPGLCGRCRPDAAAQRDKEKTLLIFTLMSTVTGKLEICSSGQTGPKPVDTKGGPDQTLNISGSNYAVDVTKLWILRRTEQQVSGLNL